MPSSKPSKYGFLSILDASISGSWFLGVLNVECNVFHLVYESMRSLKTHGHVSKHLPNSPILKINHKLNSIEVNKGRIHEELRYF